MIGNTVTPAKVVTAAKWPFRPSQKEKRNVVLGVQGRTRAPSVRGFGRGLGHGFRRRAIVRGAALRHRTAKRSRRRSLRAGHAPLRQGLLERRIPAAARNLLP